MNPCTSINCFFDFHFQVPVEVQIQRLYDAGFRRLDMNFWDWCHSPDSPFVREGWERWVEGIGETAARLGIVFVQSHAHVYNFLAEPDASDKFELYKRSLQGSAMLGIPWSVFHPSMLPEGDRDAMVKENLRFFAPLVDLAEKLGTGLAMENMSRSDYGLTTAAELTHLIDRFQSSAVGACWDTGHAHIAGVNQAESIALLGSRLHALHVQDNDGVTDQHMPPFFGTIDWQSLLGALAQVGFAHDFTFEAHMIVRRVPEGVKAEAARTLYQIGLELTRQLDSLR